MATSCLFLFYDIGAAFQYIYPGIPYIDAPIGIQLPVFMFIFMVTFTQSFLKTGTNQKIVHSILSIIIVFFLLLIFLGWAVNEFMQHKPVAVADSFLHHALWPFGVDLCGREVAQK